MKKRTIIWKIVQSLGATMAMCYTCYRIGYSGITNVISEIWGLNEQIDTAENKD